MKIKIALITLLNLISVFFVVFSVSSQGMDEEARRMMLEHEKRQLQEVIRMQQQQPPQSITPPRTAPEKSSTPQQQPEGDASVPAAGKSGEIVTPRAPQISAIGESINFFFDDADIFEVAQTVFGEVLKVNYIIDPKVTGRVNFRTVAPIPRSEVLAVMEIILRLNGIGYVEEEGLYRIVPITDVSRELIYSQVGKDPEKVAMELFTFKNVNLKDSMKDLENAIGLSVKDGKVRVLPIYRLNALLVVASTNAQLDYVRKWVETFDRIFDGARPKVYVYPVQSSKAVDVAYILQELFLGARSTTAARTAQPSTPAQPASSAQPSTTPQSSPQASKSSAAQPAASSSLTPSGVGSMVSEITKIFPDEITNSIIILATREDYELIAETIRKIDVAPRQVMIEGLIVQVKLRDNLSFGFSWSVNTDVNITNIKPFRNDINLSGDINVNSPATAEKNLSAKGFTFVAKDPTGITRAVLTALSEESKAKVLAAPHLLVSDNREAKIQVGSQVPLTTSQTSTTAATGTAPSITSTVQYKDIGIILKVKPQVNDSGLISLELSQEISSIGEVTVDVGGLRNITIDKIEVMSNLVAQDGETIIIGGLIREDTTKSKDGIPLLSKIPIFGHLFGNTTDDSTRTELIILLTPHVIRNQPEAAQVSSGYLQRMMGVDNDLRKFQMHGRDRDKGAAAGNSVDIPAPQTPVRQQ
ncbi:MAG: hypothetical protein HZA15_05065 [Nitrospirae bacterium]|nr:hypothetical protein [Nitrospirota bacterium]